MNTIDMSFLLLISWEVTSVSEGTYMVNQLIKGFRSADMDVPRLIDLLPLWDIMAHVQGYVVEESFCTLVSICMVIWCSISRLSLVELPVACGAKEILDTHYPVIIVCRFSRHYLEVEPWVEQLAEEQQLITLVMSWPLQSWCFQSDWQWI